MLILMWLVLCLAAACLVLLPLMLWRHEISSLYSGSRPVACPENQQLVAVNIDTARAVESGIDGSPEIRLCDCSRWPERSDCDQGCLRQALASEPYSPGKVKPGRKQIYHLPILLAAFAAWCVGAIWHSQHVFRTRWMDAVGLTHAQVHQMLWWLWPQLLTFAVCLLFAYGVGWLLAIYDRKGVLQGLLMSVLLGVALTAACLYGIARLPNDLIMIEAGYAAVATLMVGAIVGGLYGKLVITSQ